MYLLLSMFLVLPFNISLVPFLFFYYGPEKTKSTFGIADIIHYVIYFYLTFLK